jgi:hypothetical protein
VAVEGLGLAQQTLKVAAPDHGFDAVTGVGVFVHGVSPV